jgi:transposase-like protein
MPCPYCTATDTTEQITRTQLGYRTFRCHSCKRGFNERTGTRFNYLTVPTDIVLQVVLWRLRYKLSFCDLAEMFLERGFTFTHETVRDWEARFATLLADQLRAKRTGWAGKVVVCRRNVCEGQWPVVLPTNPGPGRCGSGVSQTGLPRRRWLAIQARGVGRRYDGRRPAHAPE